MAQAAEAAPFPNGESGLSSTHASVDVTAVLRNLKLRRVSCSTAAVPATAASLDANYDTTLSRSHLPLDAKFSAYGILSADTQTAANSSVANGNTDDAASPGPDAVGSESAALFVHRWGGYANPATPSTLSSSGLHAQSTNATPSPLRPKTSDGSSQSVGASPLTTPGPVVRPTFLAFPPASPDEAASRAGHTGPPADAYTALSPAASVPALAPLSAALEAALSQGARQQPAPPPSPPPPLKAASSMALLGQHHAHLAALHGDAVARPPLSAASSQRAFTPGAIGSPASIGNGSGALGVGGSFGGVGGLAALAEAHLSSRSASPSVRPSRVAATVFAATSAIVAATSVVAAGGGGGNAAAVAAAAAEVARDIADSVSRSPTVPPRPPSQALAKVAAAAAAAATNSSRASVDFSADAQRSAGVSSGGGAPFWAPHGTVFGAASPAGGGGGSGGGGGGGPSLSSSMSSLRRSSLELQIAKLKSAPDSPGGVPTAAASAAAANGHSNGHSNGYSNGHSNGQASSLQQSPAQRERLPETPTRPAHIITDGSGSSGGGGGPLSPGLLPPAGSAPPSPFAATAAMAAAAALLAAEVERLKQAGNRAYRSDQYPLARHCYTCALELLLAPGGADAASPGGVGGAVGVMSSDGGGAERPAAAAVAAARERAAAVAAAANGGGDGAAVGRTPGERRMISALYCSRAAAHVAMQLYADAVADCCAATAHDEAYAKPWKCRAEALASVNAFGPAAAALERCIQLTTAAEAAAAAAAANPSAAKAAGKAALAATSSGSISIGGALAAGASSGELVEFNDVDPRELPLLRHILQRLQELTRAAATPSLPAAAALLAAVHGAPAAAAPPVDHYAILGVPYHASAVDVRAAYRRLALRYHPDKAAAAAAAAGAGAGASPPAAAVVAAAGTVFPMVAEAYAVLSDSASRRAYDLRRARVTLGSRRFAGR
ncbi:Cytochrome c oxidase subunit 1 [Pleodorina starrii]|nr:Cytochrome c oxidase subunit 1 [Pleodorina starrii]